tara:strand:+ start:75011 stop:76828 length:1818 start_codon:yes stop_codon:yes gene_type:complete
MNISYRHIILLMFFCFGIALHAQNSSYLDSISQMEKTSDSKAFVTAVIDIPYDKALKNPKLFLEISKDASNLLNEESNPIQLAMVFTQIALAYHFSSEPELSIEYNLKAAQLFEENNDIESFARCYLTLGWQIKNRDLNKGLNFMNKGIRILEKNNTNSENLKFGYNNYGVLKQRINELDSALYFHKKALDLSILQKDSVSIPFALTHMAEVYLKKDDFALAEKYFFDALNLRKKRNDIYGIADSYLYIGDFYYKKGDLKKAIVNYRQGGDMAKTNGYFPLYKYAEEFLYKSYKKQGNYQKAMQSYEVYNQLKDSILNQDTNNRIAQLQVEFETSEKERKILAQDLEIKQRNLILTYLGAALVLIATIFFFINKKNKMKQLQLQSEMTLKEELAQIKTKNKLQEQRLEISRDLHDNIGSQLTFIISSLDNLKYIQTKMGRSLEEKLDEIGDFAKTTIHQLRDTIWAMNKDQISIDDLVVRFYSYIEKAKSVVPKTQFVTSNNAESEAMLPSNVGIQIFRIVQEGINNAIKYANANEIELILHLKDEHLHIEVKDNGDGFDKREVALGNGLRNMQTRADQINGNISINSEEGKGTSIILEYPLDAN